MQKLSSLLYTMRKQNLERLLPCLRPHRQQQAQSQDLKLGLSDSKVFLQNLNLKKVNFIINIFQILKLNFDQQSGLLQSPDLNKQRSQSKNTGFPVADITSHWVSKPFLQLFPIYLMEKNLRHILHTSFKIICLIILDF